MKLKLSSLLIASVLFGAAAVPAQANNDAMLDLLKVLRDKGTISAQDYDLLASASKADKESLDAIEATAKKASKSDVKITTKGKLKIEGNGWSFQPIGRVMWDAVSVDGDNLAADDFDGTELRRARLGFSGKVNDWGYKFEADFAKAGSAGKSISLKDAYVSYNTKLAGNKLGIKLGQSQIAFGFNTAASSKYMTFMDRPWYADKLTSPARQSGVAAKLSGKTWSAATSITQGSLKGGTATDDANGTTVALRGTFMPYVGGKHEMVQLGASYMSTGSHDSKVKLGNHLTAHEDPTSIKTSVATLNFDGSDAFGLDAVAVFGPFHAMAEYNGYTAEKIIGSDIDVDSFSVEAGYFLTGESMKLKHGLWSGITPKSSAGAWQVATRFETTEIDDSVAANNQQADMWTVGVNYYANKNIRFMLDYSAVTSFEKAGVSQPEPSAIKFRAQAKW